MKCKKCDKSFVLSFDNMTIFENTTIFKCPECDAWYLEDELEEEIEKLYWKESK